jgi:two-component system, sensor histidine kinase
MKPHSLRADLTRASLVTTLVAVLLSAGSLFLYELATYRSALVADLRTQADILAHSTSPALVFNDPKVALENLELLKVKPTVRKGVVFDKQGRPFASYSADPAEHGPSALDRALAQAGQRFSGSQLEVTFPVKESGDVVGTVYLLARHDAAQRALTYGAIFMAVSLLSMVLSYFVFGRLQRRVTGPLLEVSGVARQVMEKGDWSLRAPDSQNADISVLVRAFNGMLAEVEARTRLLKQADRRKDEFLATLAHELRNPLAPMTNAVALVTAPTASESVRRRAVGIMDRQLRHMMRLIDDLLDVSRITTGKLLLQKEVVDLAAVLRRTVDDIESLATQRRQSLTLNIDCEPCLAEGDPARLAQIFSNLLSNACRYTGEGGSITAGLSRTGDAALVEVCDTGVGIALEMQQRIFDLFEQADKSLERGNIGLGIGLTLARQLTQLHGGEISVVSGGLGKGSCFFVRLPVAADSSVKSGRPDGMEEGPRRARKLKVLVADDNLDYAQSLADLLEFEGHDVVVVNDGNAALCAALQQAPDLAMLDIGMPGMNGYEVARRIRAAPETVDLPLVAVTGWGQAADREQAFQAGFDRHLVKPVSVDDLMQVLASEEAREPARAEQRKV